MFLRVSGLDLRRRPKTDQRKTIVITAKLTNDGSNSGVTWNLNGPGSLPDASNVGLTCLPSAQSAAGMDIK